jgi:hypothetical protein
VTDADAFGAADAFPVPTSLRPAAGARGVVLGRIGENRELHPNIHRHPPCSADVKSDPMPVNQELVFKKIVTSMVTRCASVIRPDCNQYDTWSNVSRFSATSAGKVSHAKRRTVASEKFPIASNLVQTTAITALTEIHRFEFVAIDQAGT